MLLVLDVGNTNTTLGLYDGPNLTHSWRLTTERQRTVDEYGIMCRTLLQIAGLESSAVTDIAVSSVVPPLDFTLHKMIEVYFHIKPLFIDTTNAGMPVLYDDPLAVGADRIVNAVAAFTHYFRRDIGEGRIHRRDNLPRHTDLRRGSFSARRKALPRRYQAARPCDRHKSYGQHAVGPLLRQRGAG
jgi:hypothetical protein